LLLVARLIKPGIGGIHDRSREASRMVRAAGQSRAERDLSGGRP
jgi:hypothetical protein